MINNVCWQNFNTPVYSAYSPSKIKCCPMDSVNFAGGRTLYEKFASSYRKLDIKELKFIEKCQKSEMVGKGTEGYLFNIPFKGFENYVIKISRYFDKNSVAPLTKVINNFPNHNLGQEIANFGEDVSILRRLPEGSSLDKLCNQDDYYAKISQLPQEKFDNFFKQVKMLNKKGYSFDGGNSGNIYLDKKNNLIPIDIRHRLPINMIGDVLLPFFHFDLGAPLSKAKETLVQKLFNAELKQPFYTGMKDEALEYLYRHENKETSECIDTSLKFPEVSAKMHQALMDILKPKSRS